MAAQNTSAETYYAVGDDIADSVAPDGSIERRWDERKDHAALVSPTNRRQHRVIVVGTGLAGASAAATLGERSEERRVGKEWSSGRWGCGSAPGWASGGRVRAAGRKAGGVCTGKRTRKA